jgi:DNA-binding beta-propeller fold protein YncE
MALYMLEPRVPWFCVFVAGEKSGSIVVISPDGNSSKEVYQISSPRAMCYDKNNNKILVCNTGKKVGIHYYIIKMSEKVSSMHSGVSFSEKLW